MAYSWMLDKSVCDQCSYEIVVTQGYEGDYYYYCSNPECENHIDGEDLCDQEDCSFAINKKELEN